MNVFNASTDTSDTVRFRDCQIMLGSAKNGEPTLSFSIPNNPPHYLHSAYNPSEEARRHLKRYTLSPAHDIVCIGLGLGYELAALIKQIGAQQKIYVIERSPVVFSYFQKMPWSPALLDDERISFIINKDPTDIQLYYTQLLQKEYMIIVHAASAALFPHYYDSIEHFFKPQRKTVLSVSLLAGRGIVAPFIVADIIVGLRQNGCAVTVIPLTKNGEYVSKYKMSAAGTHVVLALDSNGLALPWVQKLGSQRAAWFVDNPFYFAGSYQKNDILFCWDKAYCADLHKAGYTYVHHLPLATNQSLFRPLILSDEEYIRYRCDVSFVGTISSYKHGAKRERHRLYDEHINGLIDRLVPLRLNALMAASADAIGEMPAWFSADLDPALQILIEQHVDYEADSIIRSRMIAQLSAYNARLFGSAELSDFTSESCSYQGRIHYRDELPKLYNGSAINVNITRPQLRTTVNQRVYDIAATRSFMLTDYRSALHSLFPFDSRVITYTNEKELNDKIGYYLVNERERDSLAEEMYCAIIRNHTYERRMAEFVAIMRDRCGI